MARRHLDKLRHRYIGRFRSNEALATVFNRRSWPKKLDWIIHSSLKNPLQHRKWTLDSTYQICSVAAATWVKQKSARVLSRQWKVIWAHCSHEPCNRILALCTQITTTYRAWLTTSSKKQNDRYLQKLKMMICLESQRRLTRNPGDSVEIWPAIKMAIIKGQCTMTFLSMRISTMRLLIKLRSSLLITSVYRACSRRSEVHAFRTGLKHGLQSLSISMT